MKWLIMSPLVVTKDLLQKDDKKWKSWTAVFKEKFQSWWNQTSWKTCSTRWRVSCKCLWIIFHITNVDLLISDVSNTTILSNIDRTRTSFFEHWTNLNMFINHLMNIEHFYYFDDAPNFCLRTNEYRTLMNSLFLNSFRHGL